MTTASAFGMLASGIVGNKLSRKTRALLERGDNPRSGQPVWRNSYYEGQIEHRLWRPIGDGTVRGAKRFAGAVIKAARNFERQSRRKRKVDAKGSRTGLLGEVGIEVLEALYDMVDFAKGRLEPAIATIADQIGRSYSAVHRALKRLRAHGFLHWVRRSRKIENPEPGGQVVEQITNAYALCVPKELRKFVSRIFARPMPGCERWRRDQEDAEWQRMLGQLTHREFHDATWSGDSLAGETLARIAALLDQQGESSKCGETGGV